MTRVAAVLVTSNSERWIEATARSVAGQSRAPDEIVVIDDRSTDATRDILARVLGDRARIVASTAQSTDRTVRIAHNFRQGLAECGACGIAVLGDHDDVWHSGRVGHQAGLLEARDADSMVASDGRLVDEAGTPVGGTLRDAFPVPVGFDGLAAAERMRTVLRHSVATGGASAVRPEAFADVVIPDGWLHDRWWSLVAAAREQLRVDPEVVIDYRVSAAQQVGLGRGHQDRGALARIVAGAGGLGATLARLRDLGGLAAIATPATHPEVSGPRLVRNLL